MQSNDDRIKIIFMYNGSNETIECRRNEYMNKIYKRYEMKTKVDLEKVFFLCNGSLIEPEKKLNTIIRHDEKLITMIVNDLNNDEGNEENEVNLKQPKFIICPICNEICLININDYKITFTNCKKSHRFTKTLFDEFFDFQTIDESKIICDKCEGEHKKKKMK